MLTAHIIKLGFDLKRQSTTLDLWTNRVPRIPKGFDVQFRCALFYCDTMADVTNIQTVTLKIKPYLKRTANSLMEKTISGASITQAISSAAWENDTAQHLLFEFDSTETNFVLGTGKNSDSYYAICYAITSDLPAKKISIGSFKIELEEEGDGGTLPPVPAPPVSYTKPEVDAMIAGYIRSSNPPGTSIVLDSINLRDKVTGGLVEVTAENGTLISTAIPT